MIRDVTENRKRTEEAIEDERLSAIQLLAAGVAHEIGNPLNSLTIHLQLIERGLRKLGPEAKPLLELVGVARTELNRLDGIVTQFLRAIRPTSPELELGSVNRVLEDTLRFMDQEIRNRDILLETDLGKRLPRILMDSNQLKQAFFNIVNNAIQAMPTGGILEASTRPADDFVVVCFRDTGGGISMEDASRIFDPFYTTRKSGSGVGLWIVQRIVRDHGGEIRIESTPGSGTLFTIRLPVAGRRLRLLEAPAAGGEREMEGEPDG
jgi:signal transduction histidine kinase